MGATRGAVMRVFLIAGASIGVAGTLLGFRHRRAVLPQYRIDPPVPLRAHRHDLFDPDIYFLTRMPAEMDPGEVIAVVVMALVAVVPRDALSVLAGGAARSRRGAAL